MNGGLPQALMQTAASQLAHAASQVQRDPARALAEFTGAIERFLLARLAQEHWSLIVAEPDSKSALQVRAGDFQPAPLACIFHRLESLAGTPLTPLQQSFFRRLRVRATAIETGFSEAKHELDHEEAAALMLQGWYHLEKAMMQWPERDSQTSYWHQGVAETLEQAQTLLNPRAQRLYASRQKEQPQGNMDECPACQQAAFLGATPPEAGECRVCGLKEFTVGVPCDRCGTFNLLVGTGFATCEFCEFELLPHQVHDALHTDDALAFEQGDPRFLFPLGHCGICCQNDILARLRDGWLCLGCFACHPLAEGRQCRKCGQYGTHFPDNTELVGCPTCLPGPSADYRQPDYVES